MWKRNYFERMLSKDEESGTIYQVFIKYFNMITQDNFKLASILNSFASG